MQCHLCILRNQKISARNNVTNFGGQETAVTYIMLLSVVLDDHFGHMQEIKIGFGQEKSKYIQKFDGETHSGATSLNTVTK